MEGWRQVGWWAGKLGWWAGGWRVQRAWLEQDAGCHGEWPWGELATRPLLSTSPPGSPGRFAKVCEWFGPGIGMSQKAPWRQ